jgi:hypothetical protein
MDSILISVIKDEESPSLEESTIDIVFMNMAMAVLKVLIM